MRRRYTPESNLSVRSGDTLTITRPLADLSRPKVRQAVLDLGVHSGVSPALEDEVSAFILPELTFGEDFEPKERVYSLARHQLETQFQREVDKAARHHVKTEDVIPSQAEVVTDEDGLSVVTMPVAYPRLGPEQVRIGGVIREISGIRIAKPDAQAGPPPANVPIALIKDLHGVDLEAIHRLHHSLKGKIALNPAVVIIVPAK